MLRFLYSSCGAVALFALSPFICLQTADAGLILDAEIKLSYEDNVVGLLTDKGDKKAGGGMSAGKMSMAASNKAMGGGMGGGSAKYTGSAEESQGDFSTLIIADIGAYKDLSASAYAFITGFAERTSYSKYSEFDSTIGGVNAGLGKSFGRVLSARLSLSGKLKGFEDSERNSAAFGGAISLKEKITPRLWLREGFQYEKNNADTDAFSYTGNSVSVGAGYSLTKKLLVTAGYNYLVRDYDDPTVEKMTSHTVSAGAELELGKSWSASAGYDRQMSESSEPGTDTADNILSIGIRYSY